jgi:hypothetical protein
MDNAKYSLKSYLEIQKRSKDEIYCETPTPKAKHIGIGKLMRPKLQKQSALKFASRIIPHKRDIITSSLLWGSYP